jgi:hypothetical protein
VRAKKEFIGKAAEEKGERNENLADRKIRD